MAGDRLHQHVVRSRIAIVAGAALLASLLVATGFEPAPATAAAALVEQPPGAPTGVVAAAGDREVQVSWQPPDDDGGSPVSGYTITTQPGDATATTMATTATITGLVNGTSYTFTVRAVNVAGTGPSSEPSGPVTPMTVPTAPTNVTATGGDGMATVAWNAPDDDGGGLSGYVVTVVPGGATFSSPGQGTSTTVPGLDNGVSYTFTVAAANAAGLGMVSAPSPAVTPARRPDAPTAVTATAGNGSATVTWSPPAGDGGSPITTYRVTSAPGGVMAESHGATTAIVTGLANGTSYTFTVTAQNAEGTGLASAPSAAITPAAAPSAPRDVVATARDASATVTWNAPSTDGGAPVATYTVTASPGGATAVTTGATTATVSGLTNGTAYTFVVTAANWAGSSSASSPSAPVIPALLPGPPTGILSVAGNGQAVVTWTAPANDPLAPVTGYTITVAPGGATSTVASPATSQAVFGLTNGVEYTFTVTAINRIGSSSNSAPSAAVVPHAPNSTACVDTTIVWTGAAQDGLWATTTNWTPARLPTSSDRVCLPEASTPTVTASTLVAGIDIHAGAELEIRTPSAATVRFSGPVSNGGTIRVTSGGGFTLNCGASMVNHGQIQVAATGGTTGAAVFAGSPSCTTATRSRFRNAANGLLESLSAAQVSFDGNVLLENDGVVNARAGALSWRTYYSDAVEDGVSTGRFAGEGGTLRLAGVHIGPTTQLGNGILVDGSLTGSAILPVDVTVRLVSGGSLYAQLSGPGWVLAQGGSLTGDIVGNVRVEPSSSVTTGSSGITIQPTGLVEITTGVLTVYGTLNNLGTVRILGQYGFYQGCLATFLNHGLLQLAPTAGSATVTTFRAEDWNCGLNNRAKLVNATDGTIESLATARVSFDGYAVLDNDGLVVARAGRLWWRSYSTAAGPSTGHFAGDGGTIELSRVQASPETQFGNGLEVNGDLSGTGSLPAGVTLTLVTSGTLSAQLSGPGWVSGQGGSLTGDIVGNVRVEPVIGSVSAGSSSSSAVTIQPTGRIEMVTGRLNVYGTLTNLGTIRVVGPYGIYQVCGSTVVNNSLIQVATTGGSNSVATFTGEIDWWCSEAYRPRFLNGPSGVLESLAAARVSYDERVILDNDGLVVSRAGPLSWRSYPGVRLVPDGRFVGDGGTVELSGVQVGPATQFGTGVVLSGSVTGSGAVPDGITVTMVSGARLQAQLAGPGWVLAQGGYLLADIVGNVRVSPQDSGFVTVGESTSSSMTIQPSGTVEIATQYTQVGVHGALTNRGLIKVTGASAFAINCQAVVTNYGVIHLAATLGSTVNNTFEGGQYCFDPTPKPKLINAVGGTFESWAETTPKISQYLPWENHGDVIAKDGTWLLRPGDATVLHGGYFGSTGSGRLVLCGLFFTVEPAEVADNVGLADGCGTIVADVTDFTPQQIQDIKAARNAALTLVSSSPPVSEEFPACYFRGVNLVELFAEYPDICAYVGDPEAADTIEFFISWMPGFGAALDIGHAIFGTDLAGRQLSPTERILDGLFAVFPGTVDQLLLTGTERLRFRALQRGAGDACNSFTGETPVLLADGTTKPISQVRRSDLVVAADPTTGVVAPRPVVDVIEGDGEKHLVDIDVSSGDRITATSNHPFWVEDVHDFVDAGSLTIGSLLRTSAGTYVQVSAVAHRTQWEHVYNLTVANLHTFHVGDAHVLVHNTNPVCGAAARKALRAALGSSPYPNGQAHHIFGVANFNSDLGRRLSDDFDIDLNGVQNGLWLPSGPYTGLPAAFKGSYHSGMSAGYYTSFVNSYLDDATSAADALDRLGNVKAWLLNGCMPINRTGVRTKPAHGTCPAALVSHYRAYGIEIELPAP
jgi:hypothetical protein